MTGGNTETTLQVHIDHYIESRRKLGQLSPDTARHTSYRLHRFAVSFGARPLNHLTTKAVERWLESLDHLGTRTRILNLSNVRSFCRWMHDDNLISADPTKGISIRKPRQIPRAFSDDQVANLLAVLPDHRAQAVVALMLYCGCRCVEVVRAQIDDYDPRDKTLIVVGKGGHQRMLPVPDRAAQAVERYLATIPDTSGPIIRSYTDTAKGLRSAWLSTLVAGWMADAGLKGRPFDGVSAHALRHTAASDVLEKSHDLRAVQEMLGHASLTTTQVYLRRADMGRLRKAMSGRDYQPAA